jgi:hypothetical protein
VKALLVATAVAAAASPTPAQIRADVKRAERSPTLWATVNVCDTRAHRDQIWIRGQMPALGFPADLRMTVKLAYYDAGRGRFLPVPHLLKRLRLGTVTHGTVQQGAEFSFAPPVTLSGSITFEWRRAGRLLASVTKLTSGHDHGVDDGDPKGYSAATCTIGR